MRFRPLLAALTMLAITYAHSSAGAEHSDDRQYALNLYDVTYLLHKGEGGKAREALAEIKRVRRLGDEGKHDVLQLEGLIAFSEGRVKEAEEFLSQAAESPATVFCGDTFMGLATVLLSNGHFSAVRYYLEHSSGHSRWHWLWLQQLRLGMFPRFSSRTSTLCEE